MFQKPNFTQVPNKLFDEMLPTLKEGELRVLMVIMRQTFGWGNKEWDRISISQLMKKSGMERMAVIRSTKSLIEKKLVIRHKEGSSGEEKCWYSLMVENEKEFMNPIDDSNNSDQYPKDTSPSILKIPTKETLTKETKSPIVPKGDIIPRKSIREEKQERAFGVFVTPTQHQDLLKRCGHQETTLNKCYDKLSTWKIGKEISGGKNDYKAMVDWVIDAVKKELGSRSSSMPSNQEWAKEVCRKLNHPEIEATPEGVLFNPPGGRGAFTILYKEGGFKDQVLGRMRKMNLVIRGIS